MAATTPPPQVPSPPVAGKKPNPPVANQQPPDGKHVPSAVVGATVQDHSTAIAAHVDKGPAPRHADQAPQTVGDNPNPPDTSQSSGQADTSPLVMPGGRFGSQPYSGLIV